MIATRELWKIRDDKVFERQNPSHAGWVCNFKKQGLLQSLRFKADLRSPSIFGLMLLVKSVCKNSLNSLVFLI